MGSPKIPQLSHKNANQNCKSPTSYWYPIPKYFPLFVCIVLYVVWFSLCLLTVQKCPYDFCKCHACMSAIGGHWRRTTTPNFMCYFACIHLYVCVSQLAQLNHCDTGCWPKIWYIRRGSGSQSHSSFHPDSLLISCKLKAKLCGKRFIHKIKVLWFLCPWQLFSR